MNLVLRYRGWQVVNLGANVPFEDLKNTIEIVKPDIVFYSAMRLNTASYLIDIGNFLIDEEIPLTYGGWIFSQIPVLVTRVPGNYVGDDLLKAAGVIESLLLNDEQDLPSKNTDIEKESIDSFEVNQIKIESLVEKNLDEKSSWRNYPLKDLRIIHSFFADGIMAGLSFGDLDLLKLDVDWIAGYLKNLNISTSFLHLYFDAYAEAVEETIGEDGKLITDWLRHL